jgi:hypothetical protein
MVPPHIVSGTRIVVDVYERTYVSKVRAPAGRLPTSGSERSHRTGFLHFRLRPDHASWNAPRARRPAPAPRFRRGRAFAGQPQGAGGFRLEGRQARRAHAVDELQKARPDWGFLLEEGGVIEGDPMKPRWIIDPLDGTTNFLHGIPHFAMSIAVQEPARPRAGARSPPAWSTSRSPTKASGPKESRRLACMTSACAFRRGATSPMKA